MCRELLGSWRAGVCSWEEGSSRPCWAPDPQARGVVDSSSVLWFAVLDGQKTGGQGRHWVPAPGAWEGCGQSVTAPGWGLISLGKQPASGHCAFSVRALFPEPRFVPAAPVSWGRRGGWLQLFLEGLPELICPGQK